MKRFKKFMAWVICFAMVVSMVPSIAVKAEGETVSLRFLTSDLGLADITYQVSGSAAAVAVSGDAASGDAILIEGIPKDVTVIIKANPKEGSNVGGISVHEGVEKGDPRVADGNQNEIKGVYVYTFKTKVNNGKTTFGIFLETNNGGQPGGPGGNNDNPAEIVLDDVADVDVTGYQFNSVSGDYGTLYYTSGDCISEVNNQLSYVSGDYSWIQFGESNYVSGEAGVDNENRPFTSRPKLVLPADEQPCNVKLVPAAGKTIYVYEDHYDSVNDRHERIRTRIAEDDAHNVYFSAVKGLRYYITTNDNQGGGEQHPDNKLEAIAYYENGKVSSNGFPLDPADDNKNKFLFTLGENETPHFQDEYVSGNGGAYWKDNNRTLVLDNLKTDNFWIKGGDRLPDTGNPITIEVAGNVSIGTFHLDGAFLEIHPGKTKAEARNTSGDGAPIQDQETSGDAMVEPPSSFPVINVGKFVGAADKNSGVSFSDEVILKVGTSNVPSEVAFENVKTVTLKNYYFHQRNFYNNVIYADTVFKNVVEVPVVSSKVKINCKTLVSGDASGNAAIIYTYQEGDITINKGEGFTYGNCQILNKYYSHYPTKNKEHPGLATDEDFIKDQPANGLVETYVAKTEDLKDLNESRREESKTSGDASGNAYYQGMYEVTVSGNASGDATKSFRLKSLDPILYSISYQADPGKEAEIYDKIKSGNTGIEVKDISATAGTFTMEGFDRGYYINDLRDGHFEAWIAAGEEVKVKIIPNEGYQYLANSVNVNSQYFDTEASRESSEVGVYTYTMGPHAGHLSAGFIKTENLVVNEASEAGVTGGTINDAGINAEMTIEEGEASDAEKAEFGKQAAGVTFDSFVDIGVAERIVKNFDVRKANDRQDAWTTPKAELEKPATVTINLDSAKYTAKDYQVVRRHTDKDNKVSYEKIAAVYDAAKHTLTFKSDKFSTYAIGATSEAETPHTHTYASTWSSDETSHWYAASCEHKTEVKDKAAHTFKEVVDKQATETEEGSKHEECSVCGYKKAAVAIPKSEKQEPKPEDNKSAVKSEDDNSVTTTSKGEATITELKKSSAKSIKVPSEVTVNGYKYTVTTIGANAFKNNAKAKTVTLPNTVTKIKANAFAKSKITTVKITVRKGAKLSIDKKAFKKSKVNKVQVTISKKATKKEKNAILNAFKKAGIKKANIKFNKK